MYRAITMVKSLWCDQLGVSPLKEDYNLHSDPKTKANILNHQFASVFTLEDNALSPDMKASSYTALESIHVSCNGVAKLLRNLKPHKATDPDGISARLLKETEGLAPAVTLLGMLKSFFSDIRFSEPKIRFFAIIVYQPT